MTTLLLVVIYLAFISLGLPDSVLGSAWPVMQSDFGAPVEMAGLISIFIAGSTIISSLFSGAVIQRLGTGVVTLVSCLMTAAALLGFSLAPSAVWLILLAVPLGLGAGAVDAGLNHYVAAHYKAHHMSWLHCFWGIGAMLGPILMSYFIQNGDSWRSGYHTLFLIQLVLVVLLLLSLPLWKRAALGGQAKAEEHTSLPAATEDNPLRTKGVKLAMLSFLLYCGVEASMGLWGSSFLVNIKDLSPAAAAQWVSTYYAGITVGRFITGFITLKVNNRTLIRMGQLIALIGTLLIIVPLPTYFALAGFILVGLGCAPVFPCMLHETPVHFGQAHAHKIMGYQIAAAYTGSTFLPPLLGWLAAHASFAIFPLMITAYAVLMLLCSERLNRLTRARVEM